MPSVIAVIQQKGGVGKTTIAANVVGELAHARRSVVAWDLDPQRSLTTWAQAGRGALHGRTQALTITPGNARRIRDQIAADSRDADFVVLDCPPGFPLAGQAAAFLADVVVLPVGSSLLDLAAVDQALALIAETRAERRDGGPRVAIVPSRVLPHTVMGREIRTRLAHFRAPVLPAITQRIAIVESAIVGLTLREYQPRSAGVREFHTLTRRLTRMVAS